MIDELLKTAQVRKVPKGQILIYEGDPITNLFRIIDGYVKVYNAQPGNVRRIIFIYVPGDMFPLTTFLSGIGVGRYFYECMTPCQLAIMPQDKFQASIRGNIAAGEELINHTMEIGQQFMERISALSSHSAQRKVISLLKYLVERAGAQPQDDFSRILIPLTSQDIAELCGLTRETVTTQLTALKNAGVITGKRTLCVNLKKLKAN